MKRCHSYFVVTTSLIMLAGCTSPPATEATQIQPIDAGSLLRSNSFAKLDREFATLQRKYEQGSITEENLRDAFRVFYPTDATLATKYDQWVSEFPRSYVARLARAIYYKKVGEEKRGGDYINQTSEQQIRGMQEALLQSLRDSDASVTLTAKPLLSYLQEMDIASLLGAPDQGRKSLDLAIKIEPDTYIARLKYMNNLETRWGGSLDEMQAFYEECKGSHLSKSHLDTLEAMVAEEQGWLHVNVDKDAIAAERDFDRADTLSPGFFCADCDRYELANLLLQQGRYSDEITVLSKILAHKPDDLAALSNRGIAYMRSGKAREALADWTKAANQGNIYSQNELGRAYMQGIPGVLEANSKLGIEWFAKAAAQGDAYAQRNLAVATASVQQQQPNQ
jgi:tetratricopeptide (TPR) repeat protein